MENPRIFIGSSLEGLNVALAVQELLEYFSEPTVWNQDVFKPSSTSLRSLSDQLSAADYGIFIFTPDDLVEIRNEISNTVRDNVLFELGLFMGKLGTNRCFIISPRDSKDFHVTTDLFGFEILTYNNKRIDQNLVASLGPVVNKIKREMERLESDTTKSKRSSPLNMSDIFWLKDHGEKKINELIIPTSNNDSPGTYLFIYDITGFQSLNLKFGKEFCDNLLNTIDAILKSSIKKMNYSSYNFRRIGDTYFIFLNVRTKEKAFEVGRNLKTSIEHFDWSSKQDGLYMHLVGSFSRYGESEDTMEWIRRGLIELRKNKETRQYSLTLAPSQFPDYYPKTRYEDFDIS